MDPDPDPDALFIIRIRIQKGVKIKEDNLYQLFNLIFQNDTKTPLKIRKHMYYKRILTFMFPVLYSPNETIYFLGCFTSWIRIRNTGHMLLIYLK